MAHDEYIKRRDEIMHSLTHELTEKTYLQAQQAIDELVLAVIGKNERKPRDYPDFINADTHRLNQLRNSQRSIVKGGE